MSDSLGGAQVHFSHHVTPTGLFPTRGPCCITGARRHLRSDQAVLIEDVLAMPGLLAKLASYWPMLRNSLRSAADPVEAGASGALAGSLPRASASVAAAEGQGAADDDWGPRIGVW